MRDESFWSKVLSLLPSTSDLQTWHMNGSHHIIALGIIVLVKNWRIQQIAVSLKSHQWILVVFRPNLLYPIESWPFQPNNERSSVFKNSHFVDAKCVFSYPICTTNWTLPSPHGHIDVNDLLGAFIVSFCSGIEMLIKQKSSFLQTVKFVVTYRRDFCTYCVYLYFDSIVMINCSKSLGNPFTHCRLHMMKVM